MLMTEHSIRMPGAVKYKSNSSSATVPAAFFSTIAPALSPSYVPDITPPTTGTDLSKAYFSAFTPALSSPAAFRLFMLTLPRKKVNVSPMPHFKRLFISPAIALSCLFSLTVPAVDSAHIIRMNGMKVFRNAPVMPLQSSTEVGCTADTALPPAAAIITISAGDTSSPS